MTRRTLVLGAMWLLAGRLVPRSVPVVAALPVVPAAPAAPAWPPLSGKARHIRSITLAEFHAAQAQRRRGAA
jgi:hypothetical protein